MERFTNEDFTDAVIAIKMLSKWYQEGEKRNLLIASFIEILRKLAKPVY
jgi:hypothetical protein